MRALLDTHVWLWMLAEPERLGDARTFLEDAEHELLLSAVSSWEITIKHALGRLPLPMPPRVFLPDRIRSSGVVPLPIEHAHVMALDGLPRLHRDPFDRMLVAQARHLDVPVVTSDPLVAAYDVATYHVATIRIASP